MGMGSETCAAPRQATRGDFLWLFCCVLLVLLFLLVFRDLGVLRLALLLFRKQEDDGTWPCELPHIDSDKVDYLLGLARNASIDALSVVQLLL